MRACERVWKPGVREAVAHAEAARVMEVRAAAREAVAKAAAMAVAMAAAEAVPGKLRLCHRHLCR